MSSSLMQPVSITSSTADDVASPIRSSLGSGGRRPDAESKAAPDRTVLGRVAAIMDAFNCSQQVLSLGDLSARTGLPKSTLHRLAEQLCQIGWIQRERGGYCVGLRLFELGSLAAEATRLREVALPHLQALSAKTGMPAHLGVFDEGEIVDLERVAAGPVRAPARRGGRFPVHCSALGKAIAAFDDSVTEFAFVPASAMRTERTITDGATMRTELANIRKLGVAFDRGEAFVDSGCAAAPIRLGAQVLGALSVTGPLGRVRWGAVAEAVDHAAAAIANANNRRADLRGR